MQSDKKEAVAFQNWFAKDVIPSINETGSYSLDPNYLVPQTCAEVLWLAADMVEVDEEPA